MMWTTFPQFCQLTVRQVNIIKILLLVVHSFLLEMFNSPGLSNSIKFALISGISKVKGLLYSDNNNSMRISVNKLFHTIVLML